MSSKHASDDGDLANKFHADHVVRPRKFGANDSPPLQFFRRNDRYTFRRNAKKFERNRMILFGELESQPQDGLSRTRWLDEVSSSALSLKYLRAAAPEACAMASPRSSQGTAWARRPRRSNSGNVSLAILVALPETSPNSLRRTRRACDASGRSEDRARPSMTRATRVASRCSDKRAWS